MSCNVFPFSLWLKMFQKEASLFAWVPKEGHNDNTSECSQPIFNENISETECKHFIFIFSFLLNISVWHKLTKWYRFQVHKSTTHHPYSVFTPPSHILSINIYPPFTLLYPPSFPSLPSHRQLPHCCPPPWGLSSFNPSTTPCPAPTPMAIN